ncbi:hypothetical protein [Spirosoma sp. 48-14]|uniref:hypothetical protein n=1 Tax=Spirosoma sp. 48-14 TaxID=1895854 RepID=UPI00095D07A3|nr:hypothetical protein [Spirosoma sp. 48-14]OJW74279.1 MAG: hypothetical protein BGO59_14285 [Spirosoma sp. 48-14]
MTELEQLQQELRHWKKLQHQTEEEYRSILRTARETADLNKQLSDLNKQVVNQNMRLIAIMQGCLEYYDLLPLAPRLN